MMIKIVKVYIRSKSLCNIPFLFTRYRILNSMSENIYLRAILCNQKNIVKIFYGNYNSYGVK